MRDFLIKFFAVCGVLTMFGLLQACFSDSNADSDATASGLSKAEVEALLAPLEQRIAQLEATATRPNVLVAKGSNSAMMAKAAADGSGQPVNEICTVLNHAPAEAFPGRMSTASCKSSTGFLLTMPITTKAEEVRPATLDDARFYFETADCSGTAYVHPDQLGEFGMAQGAVFGLITNSTFYTPPNPTVHEKLYMMSYIDPREPSGSMCKPLNGYVHGIAILPNDPEVTGIENTYMGPITLF